MAPANSNDKSSDQDNHNQKTTSRAPLPDSKFYTDCSKQHRASLTCLMDNQGQRDVCQPFFDAYKECRKAENARRREEKGGWFF